MARKTMRKVEADGLDYLANTPAPVGGTFIDWLMSEPGTPEEYERTQATREAVAKAILELDDKHKFIIEARYVWGKSFSEIMDMMGYQSKSTAHDTLKAAETNLKALLMGDAHIRKLLKGKEMNWNSSAQYEVERVDLSLKSGYKFDGDLFAHYARMMQDAVRTGDESEIVCFAWYTALEAARCLKEQRKWDPQEMLDILVSKQHDYGHDNINAFGLVGVAVRLSDKIARYYNLIRRDKVAKNEPFVDCLKDMVGYGVISAMLANDTFNEPLEGDD